MIARMLVKFGVRFKLSVFGVVAFVLFTAWMEAKVEYSSSKVAINPLTNRFDPALRDLIVQTTLVDGKNVSINLGDGSGIHPVEVAESALFLVSPVLRLHPTAVTFDVSWRTQYPNTTSHQKYIYDRSAHTLTSISASNYLAEHFNEKKVLTGITDRTIHKAARKHDAIYNVGSFKYRFGW